MAHVNKRADSLVILQQGLSVRCMQTTFICSCCYSLLPSIIS